MEELGLRQRSAEGLLHQLLGQRPLDLVAEQRGVAAARAEGGGRVDGEGDVVTALLPVVLDPVLRGGNPAEQVRVLGLAGQDAVRDDVALLRHRHVLLGLPDGEVLEVVGAVVGEQAGGVGAFDPQVVHVVREVEEGDALVPRVLLLPPARVLALDDLGGPGLGTGRPQQLDRRSGLVDAVLETGGGHAAPSRSNAPSSD